MEEWQFILGEIEQHINHFAMLKRYNNKESQLKELEIIQKLFNTLKALI